MSRGPRGELATGTSAAAALSRGAPPAVRFGKDFKDHQEFQVPKMEVLNLIRLFWGLVFPYISLTYSLYR